MLVELEKNDAGIARLYLNDPDSLNAMSDQMAGQFKAHVDALRQDASVRVVVLSGRGRAFSAGGHLEMLDAKTKKTPDVNRLEMERFYHSFLSLKTLEVPLIAALNGHAVGAGFCVALACDLRIAHKKAKLGLNFLRLGLHPGMGITYSLPRLVGPSAAAELLYTGRIFSAEEGKAYGLLNQVVSVDDFEDSVTKLATQIATSSPEAVKELKLSLKLLEGQPLTACLSREAECQARSYASNDFRTGLDAAMNKKEALF